MNKEVSLKRSHKPKGVMKKNMKNEHEKKVTVVIQVIQSDFKNQGKFMSP